MLAEVFCGPLELAEWEMWNSEMAALASSGVPTVVSIVDSDGEIMLRNSYFSLAM